MREGYRCYLLTPGGARLGALPLVSGSLDWADGRAVAGSGQVVLQDPDEGVSWLSHRVAVEYARDVGAGVETYPLGEWVVSSASTTRTVAGRTVTLDLLDKTTLLQQQTVASSIGWPAGYVVTGAVRDLIGQAGGVRLSVTDSDEELRTAMSWSYDAGEDVTLLGVANELLGVIGYSALSVTRGGVWKAAPYVLPENRPVRGSFADGGYVPELTEEVDLHGIVNRVVVRSASTADTPGLVGVAEDHTAPFGFEARGQWIEAVYDEEVTSQQVADELAGRRLQEARRVVSSVEVQHPFLDVELGDAVLGPGGEHCVVANQRISLQVGALWTSRLRRFVDAAQIVG